MKVSKTAVHNAIKKFQNEGTFKDQVVKGFPAVGMTVFWPKFIDNLRIIVFSLFF